MFQKDFKEAALSKEVDSFISTYLPYGDQESKGRFSIYQNNIIENLCEVLAHTYSACEKLVGKEFFRQTARVFIKDNLPKEAALYGYGQGFVEYFDALGIEHDYTYWGEVAAFEWAENECFFERDMEVLTLADLASYDEEAFGSLEVSLLPAIRLLKTEHNVYDIVSFAKGGENAGSFDVVRGLEYYLFYPTEQKVLVEKLDFFTFDMLSTLTQPISFLRLTELFNEKGEAGSYPDFIQVLFEKKLLRFI